MKNTLKALSILSCISWLEAVIWVWSNYGARVQPLSDFWEANIVIWLVVLALALMAFVIEVNIDD